MARKIPLALAVTPVMPAGAPHCGQGRAAAPVSEEPVERAAADDELPAVATAEDVNR
jgi:hypothetical protein